MGGRRGVKRVDQNRSRFNVDGVMLQTSKLLVRMAFGIAIKL